MGTAMATLKYALNGYISLKISLFSAFFALAGSYIGANIALSISDSAFKVIMLIIIPFIAFYVFRQKDFNAGYEKGPRSETAVLVISMISALIIGVYDGFYGPGTGTFLLLILTAVGHMPLSEANGTTKVINLTTNAAALTVYLVNGKVLLPLGLAAGCFNIAGNYLGSQSFRKNGSKIARPVMISVLIIFFVKIITELI